ncbi:MAG: hypothetical protein V4508_07430 [Pseudomonadota bacterium]
MRASYSDDANTTAYNRPGAVVGHHGQPGKALDIRHRISMTVFAKWIWSWAGFFVGGLITGSLAANESSYFILLFFGNLLVWSIIIRKIECPGCGTPVYQQSTQVSGKCAD